MRTEIPTRAPTDAFDPHRLPVFAPPAGLWDRIVAAEALRVQQRRRRQRSWAGGGAAAACAFGIAVSLLPSQVPSPTVAADQRESRSLESRWRELAGPASPGASGLSRLRLIDASLQSAYDRGARAEELAALWRQRNEALRGLIAQVQATGLHAAAITRI